MGVWRFSEDETKLLGQVSYMPCKHDPSRALWRGLTSLLPEFPVELVPYKNTQVAESLPPAVVRWVGWLLSNGYLPESTIYRLRSCGYVYKPQDKKSSFEEAISDYLLLPPRLLTGNDQKLMYLVKTAMKLLDELAGAVATLAENLQRAIGAEDTSSATRTTRERFYSEIDSQFRAWLLGVGSANYNLDSLWKAGYGIAEKLEVNLLAGAPGTAMKGRVKDKKRKGKDEKTVYDFPNCIYWFDLAVENAEKIMAVSLEGEEKYE